MKKITLLLLLLFAQTSGAHDDRTSRQLSARDTIRSFVIQLIHKEYDKAYGRLSPSLQAKLTKTDLIDQWETSTAMKGDFLYFADMKFAWAKQSIDPQYNDPVIGFFECTYANGSVLLRVYCDIRDFSIFDLKNFSIERKKYSPERNEDTSFCSIRRFIVESDNREVLLPATLTLPKNTTKKIPLAIFVHGSGPNDRDGTVGPNKPYHDIANDLAKHGIGSIRYDKRSFAMPMWFANRSFTVDDEVIRDVSSVIDYALTRHEIDPDRIYVIGHSLGAMLAPRIIVNDSRIKGIVMMAPPARKLEEMIASQVRYIASFDSTTPRSFLDGQITMIDSLTAKIKRLTSADSSRTDLLFGAPPAYYLDLARYDQVRTAASINKRILIMQGERDYQVTMNDFNMFKSKCTKSNVTFTSYPKLNHLFLEGDGPSLPKEYNIAQKVPSYVSDDIARWILQ